MLRRRQWLTKVLESLGNEDGDVEDDDEFIVYQRNLQLFRSVQYANGSKNVLRLNMQ